MFNNVQGEGIKGFFKGRKGRKLSFASQKPLKIQAGAQIVSIAKSAVSKNNVNFIVSSLKAMIQDLEVQLRAGKNPKLEANLEWAKEYLKKFEEEVKKIRNASVKVKEHELQTLLKSIEIQGQRVRKSIINISFVIVKDDIDSLKNEIDVIAEQSKLYEQSVQAYITKGGKQDYYKIVIEEKRLRVIYKCIAKKIDELKDQLLKSPTEYEIKNNIIRLEKLADDLIKCAETPELYNTIRTEIDTELAKVKVPETPSASTAIPRAETGVKTPEKHSYQEDINAYEEELKIINNYIKQLNECISKTEQIAIETTLTPEMMAELVSTDEQIKKYFKKIESSRISLQRRRKEVRDKHKIDIAKLTSIQTIKLENIQYELPYDQYIESLDRKSIEIIERIKTLALSRNNVEKEEIPKINEEIIKLYKFLQSINSLIDKRIIQHSKVNRQDITTLYKERSENRKKIVEEYKLGNTDNITVPQAFDIFKSKLEELRDNWLEAFNKAPISLSGKIMLDETIFVNKMTELITEAHDTKKIQAIIKSSELFNKVRTQIIKNKRGSLDKFLRTVRTRIETIFRSGTISETLKEGIDYNEWLTEIEYAELKLLASEPEFKNLVPNTLDLIHELIAEQEKKYQDIRKRIKFEKIEALSEEFAVLTEQTATIPMDEHFEMKITALFESMKTRYRGLKEFDYKLDLASNTVRISYKATKYNYSTGAYHIETEVFEHVVMNQAKLKEYQESRKITPKTVTAPKEKEENELQKPIIIVEGENTSAVKVTNRTIQLATTQRQVINRAKNLILAATDSLTVSLIKQGLRIKYNENLRNQLKELNAKLSLVNKSNYSSRKDIKFNGDETEQDLVFKTKKENFNIDDYKLEIRIMDDEKKKSDLLYSYDLENIAAELHNRTR